MSDEPFLFWLCTSLTLAVAVIARSEATWQSDPKGRHERSEVISLLVGIASPACCGFATASPDCFALLAMTEPGLIENLLSKVCDVQIRMGI